MPEQIPADPPVTIAPPNGASSVQFTATPLPPLPADLPPAAAALMPAVDSAVSDLANLPPGPDAQNKAAVIMRMVASILLNPAVAAIIPNTWKGYVAAGVASLLLIAAGLGTGRYVFPSIPVAHPPITVNVHPPGGAPVIAPGVTPPPLAAPPIVPPAGKIDIQQRGAGDPPGALAPKRLVLYLTLPADSVERKAILDAAALKALPVSLAVDPTAWQAGSYYPWGGQKIPLPCAALTDFAGKVLAVTAFVNAADLANWAAARK